MGCVWYACCRVGYGVRRQIEGRACGGPSPLRDRRERNSGSRLREKPSQNCASVILIGGMLSSSRVGVEEPERGKEDVIGVDMPDGSSSTMKRTRWR